MGKVLGVFLGLIAILIAGAVALFAFPTSGTTDDTNPIAAVVDDAKIAAANATIDATGAKEQVKQALETHADAIAAATGLTVTQVDEAVANLDIDNWQASTLPSGVTATGTIDGSQLGLDGTLTTYDDPGYVTVEAYGQSIALQIPESAQGYVGYLEYLQ